MRDLAHIVDLAEGELDRRDYAAAVSAANELIDAGEPWLLDGLMLRATALEAWTAGPLNRMEVASGDWARTVEISPCSVAHMRLARVLMKLGDREPALLHLRAAEKKEALPEVLLGLAEYFRTASPPDLQMAKSYYLRAALRGRTQGMIGYGEVASELGEGWSALCMAIYAFLATPFLIITIGKRRHAKF